MHAESSHARWACVAVLDAETTCRGSSPDTWSLPRHAYSPSTTADTASKCFLIPWYCFGPLFLSGSLPINCRFYECRLPTRGSTILGHTVYAAEAYVDHLICTGSVVTTTFLSSVPGKPVGSIAARGLCAC